jgi:hypothetical protein
LLFHMGVKTHTVYCRQNSTRHFSRPLSSPNAPRAKRLYISPIASPPAQASAKSASSQVNAPIGAFPSDPRARSYFRITPPSQCGQGIGAPPR